MKLYVQLGLLVRVGQPLRLNLGTVLEVKKWWEGGGGREERIGEMERRGGEREEENGGVRKREGQMKEK